MRCGPVSPSFGAQIDLRAFQFDFGRDVRVPAPAGLENSDAVTLLGQP